ncbi:myeloid-derived growth factor [Nerophis lumbriciformis]|uniref:myeloid-derived growth factor n=1 Tax=Nerophis lumbriciformis TaxID=546530 RepID=UPI003BAD55C7
MANAFFNNLAFSLVFVLLLLAHFPGQALGEQTKTTEFDVRPGGMVHTFTEYILMPLLCTQDQSDTNKYASLMWPTGTSYLFFTQFKMELKGTKIEYANASSQARAGQKEVVLSAEEYTIGESAVTHTEGKFKAQLAKLTAIGRTRHQEL